MCASEGHKLQEEENKTRTSVLF